MKKELISFTASAAEDGSGRIEARAVMMTPAENKQVRAQLEKMGAEFINIDSECLWFELEGDYKTVKKLEAQGWEFV